MKQIDFTPAVTINDESIKEKTRTGKAGATPATLVAKDSAKPNVTFGTTLSLQFQECLQGLHGILKTAFDHQKFIIKQYKKGKIGVDQFNNLIRANNEQINYIVQQLGTAKTKSDMASLVESQTAKAGQSTALVIPESSFADPEVALSSVQMALTKLNFMEGRDSKISVARIDLVKANAKVKMAHFEALMTAYGLPPQ